jgi:hypothetical protein
MQQLESMQGNAHWLGTFHTGAIAGAVTGLIRADPRKFPPVAMMVEETSLVAVRADSPLRVGTDLVAALKADPSRLRIAVAPALGQNTHMAIAKPLKAAGVAIDKLTIAPFRSSGESVTALLGGHVDVVSATAPVIVPHVQAGKLRILASASAQRGSGPLAEVKTWREQAQVMAAGPHVVRQAYGVEVDKNDLGGWKAHRKSALVHNEAVDEADALAQVKRFLSYLPRSVFELAPLAPCGDDPNRADDALKDAIPHERRKIYDPRRILGAVFDRASLFETGRWHGGSVITMLGRLAGVPVGVIANDPKVAGGAMTLQAAYKMERHTRLCSQFGLPVVNFVDQPGNATGLEAELAGTLLGATRLGEALAACRSPWVSILIRRCFGMAGALHGPKGGDRLNHRFAWPSARWGSIPIEGGVIAAHKAEIEAAPDPAAKRAELEAHYLDMTSPFRTAEKFGVLEIIDPRETRMVLCDWVEDAWHVVQGDLHRRADRREP